MIQRLRGKVAIVTGGGRGLGRAIALRLAQEGTRVIVNDLGADLDGAGASHEPADAAAHEIASRGGEAIASYHDISKYHQARELFGIGSERFGRIDILINSAGNARPRLLRECTQEDFDIPIDVMLKGKLYCTQMAAQHMATLGWGRIVNLASHVGLIPTTRRASYAAAQAGIIGFSKIASAELASFGVTVNTICPGATASRLIEDAARVANEKRGDPVIWPFEQINATLTPSPPDNLAEFVTYLCTDGAAQVNGQVFYIGGGHIACARLWELRSNIYKVDRWSVDELTAAVSLMLK